MMKEPELEERRLSLVAEGDTAKMELRTLLDTAPPLQLETPEGRILEPIWREKAPGIFTAEAPIDQLGLYRAEAGGLEAVALNGPANPKEYADLQSSTEIMAPFAKQTGGGIFRLNAAGTDLPDIRRVSARGAAAGSNWLRLAGPARTRRLCGALVDKPAAVDRHPGGRPSGNPVDPGMAARSAIGDREAHTNKRLGFGFRKKANARQRGYTAWQSAF